jgi:hypothetical protein
MDIQFLMKQAEKAEKAIFDATAGKARAAGDEHLGKATGGVEIPGMPG